MVLTTTRRRPPQAGPGIRLGRWASPLRLGLVRGLFGWTASTCR